MYTVVIPTMWIPNPLLMRKLFKHLDDDILIQQIILIDNDPTVQESIKNSIIYDLSKVQHIRMPENIYVNPAWNLGVFHTKTPYVILLNDDFFTDKGVSSLIKEHFSHPNRDVGLYGMNEQCYPNYYGKEFIEEMEEFENQVTIVNGGFSVGWGCCIILPTSKYVNIPNNLKIWFGDNFILDSWVGRGLPTFNFKNLKVSKWSTTINAHPTILNPVIEKDRDYYEKTKSR